MTTIYVIPDLAKSQTEYICDFQTTIDSAPINLKPFCTVGTQDNANAQLLENQQAWLTQQAELFTVNLQTTVEGGIVWTVINLFTEPENADRQYFVLYPTTGEYTEAIGLTAAQALLQQTQQNYLVFTNMNEYQTWTEWPVLPAPLKTTTTE